MLFYLFPYIYITFISLNIYFSKLKVTYRTLIILLLPAILVFALRGNVGTDSIFYLGLLQDYRQYGESDMKYEPGFEILNKLIAVLGATPRLGVAIIGLISTFILCKTFSRSKTEMLLLALIVFPFFFFDFTMNGIRYGLSFCLATLAIDALYKKKYWTFTIWSLLACSMQYSAIVIILLFVSVLVKKRYVLFFSALLLVFIISFPNAFSFFIDRLTDKKDAYTSIYAPGLTSGLAPLLATLMLYAVFLYFNRFKKYSNLIHIIIILEFLFFILAKFTYAGLRFQGIILYCMILYFKNNFQLEKANLKFAFSLFLMSVFGILLYFKNITTVVQDDYTPFLPYKFYWEERYPDRL